MALEVRRVAPFFLCPSTFNPNLGVEFSIEGSRLKNLGLFSFLWGGELGFGFRVQGSGFRLDGSQFKVSHTRFGVQGSGFRVQGSGFRVQGSGFRA